MSIPIACALDGDELRHRWEHWSTLVDRSCRDRMELPDGIRLTFDAAAGDDLRQLVAAEQVCCGWATWSLEPTEDAVVLTATAPDPLASASLQAFFGE